MKTKQVEMEAMREAELKHKRKVCCVSFKIYYIYKFQIYTSMCNKI